MPSYLDLALLLIVAVSALLSMVRGFTREVLAIASWGVAAIAAYYFHPYLLPYLAPYIAKDSIARIVAVAVVFFVTLIVVSIITVKLSDAILDSKVGALDRTLGFVFGAARGFLLGVIAFQFFTWLLPANKQPEWVVAAKSRPLLQATGDEIVAMLPEDPENYIKKLKSNRTGPGEEVPPDQDTSPSTAPDQRTEVVPPAAKPAPAPAPVQPSDRQKLDSLINKSGGQAGKKL